MACSIRVLNNKYCLTQRVKRRKEMTESPDNRINDIWDQRWEGSEESEKLTIIGRLMFKSKIKVLKDLINKHPVQTVIEVGCCLGHTMSVYSKMGLDCSGIDISKSAVNVCRMKGLNAELKNVEQETRTFDMVSSDGMLEHILHFEPLARHLMRISKKYVLLIQPNHESIVGKSLVFLAEILRSHENVHEYNYRIDDFISVFENNNFRIIENIPVFMDVFRVLVFEKG